MTRIGLNNVSQQRFAAVMALFGMLMLFMGPVFSQVQAFEQHDAAGQPHSVMPDCHMADMQPSDNDHKAAIFHWFDQCGYCSLWQHFPTAPFGLPVIMDDHEAPAIAVRASPASASAETISYSQAQPRAPPSIS